MFSSCVEREDGLVSPGRAHLSLTVLAVSLGTCGPQGLCPSHWTKEEPVTQSLCPAPGSDGQSVWELLTH